MSTVIHRRFSIAEVSKQTGLDRGAVNVFVEKEWIIPVSENEFDEEDVARIRLIRELQSTWGVNDEAIPIILRLLDQLYALRHHLMKF